MATAAAVMDRARRIIQDETSVRWPLDELCLWLNDGLREIRLYKPAAFGKTVTLNLAEGARQTLPPAYERILDVIGNERTAASDRGPRHTLTIVDRSLLNVIAPDWREARRKKQQVRHLMFDEADPRSFYVYPVNDGTGAISVIAVQPHTDIAPAGAADDLSAYSAALPVDDTYANALVDYLLYRMYAKDAQFSANAERAVLYYQSFIRAVGVEITQDANTSLNTKPGVARSSVGSTG